MNSKLNVQFFDGVRMQPITNIIQLRQLLAERFPGLRQFSEQTAPKNAVWPTGLASMDNILQGGLAKSALTELVSTRLSAGSALVIAGLLHQAYQTQQWLGLIDGQDGFDPTPLENTVLSRLLWVRCRETKQALKAVDILLRDGNLPLVVFDLRLNPADELRRVPATTWYRLQRIVEMNSTALLVVTPRPMVNSAHARLLLESHFELDALTHTGAELLGQLKFHLVRSWAAEPESGELIAQTA